MHYQLDRVGTAEQNFGDCIFRGAFGTGVAPDTDALLAATGPEPCLFRLDDVAGSIQQVEADAPIGGGLDKKRAVTFDRGLA